MLSVSHSSPTVGGHPREQPAISPACASAAAKSSSQAAPPPSSPSSLFSSLPPSLREILDAFASNGSGDRELLLAILGAKRAEEERLAAALAFTNQQLFLLQAPQFVQPFHALAPVNMSTPPLDGRASFASSSSSSSASSSASTSPGPSTPPPSHSLDLAPSSGPVRSAKLSLVRSKLLEKRNRGHPAPSPPAGPSPRVSPSTSISPQPQTQVASRRTVSPQRVPLGGLLGLRSAGAGVVGRSQESFVRGTSGGSEDGDEDEDEMDVSEPVVRVKLEGQ